MKITIKDYSMSPFLKPDDEVEFEPGRPIPNDRICLVKIGSKKRVRQVFQDGEYYRLKLLNSNWEQLTEFVHVEKCETFVITEKCRDWLNERWKAVSIVRHSQNCSDHTESFRTSSPSSNSKYSYIKGVPS